MSVFLENSWCCTGIFRVERSASAINKRDYLSGELAIELNALP